jgi:hypothetical protein
MYFKLDVNQSVVDNLRISLGSQGSGTICIFVALKYVVKTDLELELIPEFN